MAKGSKRKGLAARLVPDLNAEREKLATAGGGTFWRPMPGEKYYIRVIPFVHDGEMHVFREVHEHFGAGNRKGATVCSAHDELEPRNCAICAAIEELGLADTRIVARPRFYCNIVVRGEEDRGSRVYAAPPGVARRMLDAMDDEELGDEVWDPEEGRDLQLEKRGSGLETEYLVKKRVRVEPIDPDIYAEAQDLLDYEILDPLNDEALAEIADHMGSNPNHKKPQGDDEDEETEEGDEDGEARADEGELPDCYGLAAEYDPDDAICKACDFRRDCAKEVKAKASTKGKGKKGK